MSNIVSDPLNPQELTLVGVAYRCQEEQQKFKQGRTHKTIYCFDLWRRALENPNDESSHKAWEFVYKHFYPNTLRWAEKHPVFPLTGEDSEYFATMALVKMWEYFAKGQGDFGKFSTLAQVLKFLQMCVNAVIVDYWKKNIKPFAHNNEQGDNPLDIVPDQKKYYQDIEITELWAKIYQKADTDLERRFIYAYFELQLPRRKIAEMYPEFGGVQGVKRVREPLMNRIARDKSLKHFLESYL